MISRVIVTSRVQVWSLDIDPSSSRLAAGTNHNQLLLYAILERGTARVPTSPPHDPAHPSTDVSTPCLKVCVSNQA